MAKQERRADEDLRERLQEIEDGYLARADENAKAIEAIGKAYGRFARRATRILLAVAVVLALGAAAGIYFRGENEKRQRETSALVRQNAALVGQLADLVREIQQQRRDAVLRNCRDQNKRHDETIKRLRVFIARIPDPARRAQAQQSIKTTIKLIDALAPKRSCVRLADKTVGSR